MGRILKFRGKRVDNGEWRICSSIEVSISGVTLIGYEEVIPDTVGQFTGLLDKNGTEIFEGDIIVIPNTYKWYDKGVLNYIGMVEWIYSQWQVVAHCVNPLKSGISSGINEGLNDEGYNDGERSEWEIIGNIYDNPELLNSDSE